MEAATAAEVDAGNCIRSTNRIIAVVASNKRIFRVAFNDMKWTERMPNESNRDIDLFFILILSLLILIVSIYSMMC